MTRRRFYAPPIAFSPGATAVKLSPDETRHLRDVLRLRIGDQAYVFNGEGHEFRCVVQAIEADSTTLQIFEESEAGSPESPLNLTLAVALLKGEKFDLVVQKATELGVNQIIPIVTARADVKMTTTADAEKKRARWQRIALEATKQCGRARLMKVDAPLSFADLIEHPRENNELRLMFAERGGDQFALAFESVSQAASVTAIVGSEGGWTDEEIKQARAAGWKIVTLGGRIMRAETAAIAIAALLQHRFGDLV
jgi:16S rRNA (uracil1498-N3)-methyltransferase